MRYLRGQIWHLQKSHWAVALMFSALPCMVAQGSSRSWAVDSDNPMQPARINVDTVDQDPAVKVLRSPSYEVNDLAPQKPKTVVVKQSVPRYVPQRLRFDRISITGNPVEPRVRFQRDPEIFSTDSLTGEKIRGDFFQKVADDLNP
jgi:hypothetical protein